MANETEAQHPNDNPCDTDGAAHAFELVLERIIDAPPEKVFKAYTDPAILAQWFAPKPWKIVDPIIEPRVGGRFNFTMHGPDGEVFPNSGVFLDVVPNRRIDHHRRLHLRLEAGGPALHGRPGRHGADRRRQDEIHGHGRHWNAETMKQHEQMGFHEGWGTVADQLAEIVKTL